ncbi:DUF2306 domain-containing protein [Neorhizobium galegae]|uniref:DUF2306 domain-containing protein n=1 Tax=Neorhizobium galegae TaxID=399 RepID=UPI002103B20A|nr:DUF2306 domain-containing protein [Neorhizobium galegae]MCQ1781452.1 DUF2306 domain-containing protein [Neorhizobium galegae]MCQ1797362.1 DUF2306 domain-containing protein [Neorhizobium galegae]
MTAFPGNRRSFHSLDASRSARLLVAVCWLSGLYLPPTSLAFSALSALAVKPIDGTRRCPVCTIRHRACRRSPSAPISWPAVSSSCWGRFGRLRRSIPRLHRWLGRIYVVSAAAAGVGGLAFIVGHGTIGGTLMDVGFGLRGGLMVLSATMSYLHARSGRYSSHRAWAIRLFALTIGSWLYRIEYGAWFLLSRFSGSMAEFSD